MKRMLHYLLGVVAILLLTRCNKQHLTEMGTQPIKTASLKRSFDATSYPSYNTSPLPPDQTGMTSTAVQIAAKYQLGINIGNTMEAINNEQGWGNPVITQALIDSYKRNGFTAIRIPCEWDWSHIINRTTEQIDPAWLARVQQVVQYCVNDGLYAILNIHYDGGWLEDNCTTAAQAAVNAKQKALWEQIATQLRGFDEHLIFASANEPAVSDTTGMRVLLSYHQTFINAVRSTGGHNTYRNLIVQGPSTDIVKTNTLFNTMPTDPTPNRLTVEIHYYTPYNFCLMTSDASWGNMFYYWGSGYHTTFDPTRNATYGEESDVNTWFQMMKTKFVNNNIPVIMGEFDAIQRSLNGDSLNFHLASRAYWHNYIVHQALAYGIHPFLWDTGFLIDRNSYAVKDVKELAALVQGTQTNNTPALQSGSVYQIINRYSFKALEIGGWATANGALADQWDYLAGANQQFKVQSVGTGTYLLTPTHVSGKCLEVYGWSGSNGGAVDMWDYTGSGAGNQQWLIQATDNGFYKILNVNSGKALEVTLGSSAPIPFRNGSAADQYTYSGGKNQQWAFVKP